MDIGIIGAGITGLSAAWRLKKTGCRVTVYEASDHVGGVIQSFREGGFLAESGPHSILDQENRIGPSLGGLGLAGEKVTANPCARRRYIVRNRKPVAVPNSPGSFFLSELFSVGAKLRLLREPFIAPKVDTEEENLAHFIRRRLGPEILDYGVDPLVAGIYAGDPEKLSVQHAFPKLAAMEREHGSMAKAAVAARKAKKENGAASGPTAAMYSFREGIASLPKAIASQLAANIRLNAPVTTLSHDEYGFIVECLSSGEEQGFWHDAILVTTPTWQLPNIKFLGDTFRAASKLRQISYPPVTTLTLGFHREHVAHPLDGFGMLVPRAEGLSLLGTLFTSSLFPHRAPAGHVLLTSFLGGARNPGIAMRPMEALRDIALHDLRMLLGVTGDPVFVHVDPHSHAIPQYEVGYGKFLGAMKNLERENPGFFIAGNFRGGTSVAQAFGSGRDAADRILAYHRERQRALTGQEAILA